MSTNIQLLRSSIAEKRPSPATLLDGQAAVNLSPTEPGLYFKLSTGSLTKVGPVCVNANGQAPNASPAGASGNSVGEMWFDGRATFTSPVAKIFNGTTWLASSGFIVDDTTGNFSLTKTITQRNSISNGTGQYSYNVLPSGPTTDETLITNPVSGMVRFDTTTASIAYYDGSKWVATAKTDGCNILPTADNSCNLGSPTFRWANIYTGDLHLKNERGDWTFIEEEDYLSLRNNKTGVTYALTMTEVK